MKVLITGAGGLVGSHLARALGSEHRVLALKHRDLDITDAPAVRRRARDEQPSLIINCAVVGVDECERDPALARAVNITGARLLAEVSAEIGSEFLHFSSNYVFDGNRSDGIPYTTDDEPRPINVYGRTKLQGERSACAASERTYVIRTSWVFGQGKANFLSTAHERLTLGLSVSAITDIWASATYVADLVGRTREILARRRYGVYQIVNEGTLSYHDFAVEVAGLAGLSAAQAERLIESVTQTEMERTAPRPRCTPMRCLLSAKLNLAPMPHWRSALADYVLYEAGR